jgi:hypothetical protein
MSLKEDVKFYGATERKFPCLDETHLAFFM